jgi:hypothetical protein
MRRLQIRRLRIRPRPPARTLIRTLAEQAEARLRYRYGLSETSSVVTVEARLTVEEILQCRTGKRIISE